MFSTGRASLSLFCLLNWHAKRLLVRGIQNFLPQLLLYSLHLKEFTLAINLKKDRRNSVQEILPKYLPLLLKLHLNYEKEFSDFWKVKANMTGNASLRKPKCVNGVETVDFRVQEVSDQYWVTEQCGGYSLPVREMSPQKCPILHIQEQKSGKSKSLLSVSRCIPKAAAERCTGDRSRQGHHTVQPNL